MTDKPATDFQRLISNLDASDAARDLRAKLNITWETLVRAIESNKEILTQAYVAQHGFHPDETQIVQQQTETGFRIWVEKPGDFDELRAFRAREGRLQRAAHEYANNQHPAILEEIAEALGSDPTEGNDQAKLAAEYAETLRQNDRFLDREHLVRDLLREVAILEDDESPRTSAKNINGLLHDICMAAESVRNFDLKGSDK